MRRHGLTREKTKAKTKTKVFGTDLVTQLTIPDKLRNSNDDIEG